MPRASVPTDRGRKGSTVGQLGVSTKYTNCMDRLQKLPIENYIRLSVPQGNSAVTKEAKLCKNMNPRSILGITLPPPPDGATARGGPWPPLQCASRPLDSLLCLSIHLNPSSSCPWTRHPATSFLAFLFVLLHTAFRTSFLELQCLAFFLCDQATVFFGV